MAISNRSAADLKSFAIETLVAFEKALAQVQKLSAQLAPFTDTQVGTQLGIADTDANTLKSAVAAITTSTSDYSATAHLQLLGVHPV